MKLRVISKSGELPRYETAGSAGFDIAAFVDAPIVIRPGERALIPTGLFFQLESGYEAQIRARSGLAVKKGIGLVNGIGTVDSDYRGEVCVPLINWGQEDFIVENGDRIAQVVIARYEHADFELTDSINDTARGTGGFGHTGV